MTVEINGKEHFFNDNAAKLDDKYNPIIRIWYYIFFGINIVNIFLYVKNIHTNTEILFFLPFFHVFITYIFWIIKRVKASPNGDKEYIKTYYPDIAEKLRFGERNSIGWYKFLNGEYIEYDKDFIIDDIRVRKEENNSLMLTPFKFVVFFWIASIIVLLITKSK
jgi:hypothetical protein